MKARVARKSGFCFGVKRAIQLAEDAAKQRRICSIGPLIHNEQAVGRLKEKGVEIIDDIKDARDAVIIRTHGVPNSVIGELRKKGIEIIDATCPLVKKIQDLAIKLEDEGYRIIVAGEKRHPEIKGILGNLKRGIVVESTDEARKIEDGKIAIVSQTTQSRENFNGIVNKIKELNHGKIIRVYDTICNATLERQQAAEELAKESDLMIVVGGRQSGNTKRLYEICKGITDAHHIEQAGEIRKEWFKNVANVGICAGASTPDEAVKEVIKKVENGF